MSRDRLKQERQRRRERELAVASVHPALVYQARVRVQVSERAQREPVRGALARALSG